MTLSLRQLEIFEMVATTGSATKASERLFLTQSAVSMALAQLEQQSAQPLFERSGRQLLLNDSGRLLLSQAREILQAVRQVERQLRGEIDEELAGELLVGGSTTIGNYLLPGILGDFARKYPKAKVQLKVGNTQQIADALEEGILDIAFIEGPCHTRGLVCVPWRDDQLVVITAPGHPWSGQGKVSREELESAPWIMREKGSGTREVFERAMEEAELSYAISLEFGHTEAIKNGVASGLGVSCLSRVAVHREVESGHLVEVETPLRLGRSLALIKRQGSCVTPLLRAFLEVAGASWKTEP